ncbi:MAG: hypothetical protein WC506_06445 [Candidatus Micrarchaeia archaeon]
MARVATALLFIVGFLILSPQLALSQVPAVPDPTCAGGFLPDGTFIPKEEGGCCHGTDCCNYAAFTNLPQCACTGLDCCKYEVYKNTPLCVITPPTNPNTSLNTTPPPPLGTVPEQTPYDEESYYSGDCTAPPTECPIGGSSPELLDPDITSGSKCRGACGPDCPDTCMRMPDYQTCVPDAKGQCLYVCTYQNVIQCGVHTGCQAHDACYDRCAEEKGEKSMCYLGGFCHCGCDWDCISKYGPINCAEWMLGYGPTQSEVDYSSPPLRSGPFRLCPL